MKIYDSRLWKTELEELIMHFPVISQLEDKTVLVTGAAGLVCSAIIDVLIHYNETHARKIGIIAAGRNKENIDLRFSDYSHRDYFHFVRYDATSTSNQINLPCDYIIHGASNASPDSFTQEPVETMMSNIIGTKYLLDYAKNLSLKRMLYISSSEVYGVNTTGQPLGENEYGYIDLLKIRSSYSMSKRAAETLCVSYCSEYEVDTVIVRPGHVYGPTARQADNRVSSSWVYDAAFGKNIIMKSDGSQIRSYCYCLDCVSAILTVLLQGEQGKAYNISNPQSIISIREMAEIIAHTAGVSIVKEFPEDSESKSFNPMTNSSLDSTMLLELGWKGLYDAERGFKSTVEILKDMNLEKTQ